MQPLNILIVEDDAIVAADIQETLEKFGHNVTDNARTFQEAITSARRLPPDLAIIDIRLKDSSADGIQTARELQNQRWIPIIYLTGHSEPTTVERAKETSPAAYLLKPFRQQELGIQVELAYYNFRMNEEQPSDPTVTDSVFLPYNKGYEKIAKNDVVYLRASGAYTHICLVGEEKPRLFTLNLGYLAQYFPNPNFYRISRSLLINLNHIVRLESTQLLLSNQVVIPIPEGSRADLLKKLSVIRTR
ncbi:hypothetical protein GCM10028807_19470 [Spirosoma daeguense]